MIHWIFLTLSLFSISSFSQTVKLRSAEALSTAVDKKAHKFSATVKPGFHFNDKAPNSLTVDEREQKLLSVSKAQVEFELPSSWNKGRAALYVCDDAVTYCETHSVELQGDAAAAAKVPANKDAGKGAAVTTSSGTAKPAKFGFIEDDFEKALSVAKEKKRPVMIEFSARWCPGCVRYEKEIFSAPRFSKITKNVVKLKVDVDRFQNSPVIEKYGVHGIPTIVVINSQEQEISRLVDFQPLDGLEKFLKTVSKDARPMNELLAIKNPDAKTSVQLGQRLFASGQAAESIPYFEKAKPVPPQLLAARIEAVKKTYEADKTLEKNKTAYAQELREAIKSEPLSTRSLAWRSELVSLLDPASPEVKTMVADGTALSERLLKEPRLLREAIKTDELGEFLGFEKLWVAILRADLTESANLPAEAITTAWSQAAEIGTAYKISAKKSGPALRYLIVLTAAKKYTEAQKFADEILKQDPNNTDVKRRKIKILLGLQKPEEAAKLAEQILPEAEGRNQFWVAESLAKAYIASNKKNEASKILTEYLARPEMNEERMKPSKKSFEDLLKTTL